MTNNKFFEGIEVLVRKVTVYIDRLLACRKQVNAYPPCPAMGDFRFDLFADGLGRTILPALGIKRSSGVLGLQKNQSFTNFVYTMG